MLCSKVSTTVLCWFQVNCVGHAEMQVTLRENVYTNLARTGSLYSLFKYLPVFDGADPEHLTQCIQRACEE